MYNSIIDFIENDTTKIKKILEKYLFAGNTLRFEEDLMRVMIEFGRKIYQECLKEIEENIRQSEFRKKLLCRIQSGPENISYNIWKPGNRKSLL